MTQQAEVRLEGGVPCEACQRRGKTWQGDDPKCAFRNGRPWSPGNWNCATDGLLRALYEVESPLIFHVRRDDQNVMTVCTVDLAIDAQALVMTWYKHRGRTEQAWLIASEGEPRRPTEEDAVRIAAHFGITPDVLWGTAE